MKQLTSEERLRLVRFVCAMAWADLKVQEQERGYVRRLLERLDLSDDEQEEAEAWLRRPPEVDPAAIPTEHKELFLDSIRGLIASDLTITQEEKEMVGLLEELLSANPGDAS